MSAATGPSRPRVSRSGRLIKTFVSCGVGNAISLIATLCLLPLFLGTWGKDIYAEWVLLSAIPGYLTVTDLGFGFALGNHIAMQSASDDKEAAARAYRAGWTVV